MISEKVFMTILAVRKIQKLSVRKIARLTGKHRETITKYLAGNALLTYQKR